MNEWKKSLRKTKVGASSQNLSSKVKTVKIAIINRTRNELLKRDEVTFKVDHEEGGTPHRTVIRQRLSDMLNASLETVYLIKFETKTGSMTAVGEARKYDTVEQAKYAEPEHIILRNSSEKEKQE